MDLISIDTIKAKLGFQGKVTGYLIKLASRLFLIDELNKLYNSCPDSSAQLFFDSAADYLGLNISVQSIENFPRQGACMIISNHPTGIIDGIVLCKTFLKIRRDIKVVVNYLMEDIKKINRLFIYVNPFDDAKEARSSHSGIKQLFTSLQKETAIILFPAGDVSGIQPRFDICDNDWNATSLKILQKNLAPIVPVFIEGRNSRLFYISNHFSTKLGLLLLVRELFNKRKQTIKVTIGTPFFANEIASRSPAEFNRLIRKRVYDLKKV